MAKTQQKEESGWVLQSRANKSIQLLETNEKILNDPATQAEFKVVGKGKRVFNEDEGYHEIQLDKPAKKEAAESQKTPAQIQKDRAAAELAKQQQEAQEIQDKMDQKGKERGSFTHSQRVARGETQDVLGDNPHTEEDDFQEEDENQDQDESK